MIWAVINEAKEAEVAIDVAAERSEADKIVDGMDFGELCNEFECISSPSVEATARQLARDILEQREGNRALGTFAVSVKYKVFHIHSHLILLVIGYIYLALLLSSLFIFLCLG